MTSDPVLVDRVEGVATITLNRPEAMNSLDVGTKEALLDAVRSVADDPAGRCAAPPGSGRGWRGGRGAMNSLHGGTKEALLAAVRSVADDPAVRCAVLTGSGRSFCVGQDLKEH